MMLETTMPETVLDVNDLMASRGGRVVWSSLSFSLASGSLLYVTGANGSGKTTLLSTLAGVTEPDEGRIFWHGLATKKSYAFRRQMAYLAHGNGLNADVDLIHNLEYAAQLAGNIAQSQIPDAVRQALVCVGLEELGHRPLRHLSQGQQRRAGLARLLLQRTHLWLLDEPFNALDKESTERFGSMLAAHLQRGGMAVISTHQRLEVDAPQVCGIEL